MISTTTTIAWHVQQILQTLSQENKFDIGDENFTDTPARVEKAYRELLEGYRANPEEILSKSFPSGEYDQMIVVKDIDYYSLCAHHMLPFYGKVAIGYLPGKDGRVVGLSKLPRLVRAFSRRFQLQERMTQDIACALQNVLNPRGVGVLVYDSIHMCSHMRGVEDAHSTMETSALHGDFRNDAAVRAEFFNMVYGRR
jgi:GTP cyclohydrolase I